MPEIDESFLGTESVTRLHTLVQVGNDDAYIDFGLHETGYWIMLSLNTSQVYAATVLLSRSSECVTL